MSVAGLILLVLALLVLRQSVVIILMTVALYVHMVFGAGELSYLIGDLWSSINKDVLLAVPVFLLVGQVVTRGSIAKRLIELLSALTAPMAGGLAIATVLTCAVFSAISGSSVVTLLAVGTVMYPALLERGYSKSFSIGCLCAGGTLGMLIPPSVPMILYGVVTQSSITDLFIAGIGPGILVTAALAGHALIANRHIARESFDIHRVGRAVRRGIWALMLPFVLLGGIYSGYFSPTEAAAVALLYALIVEIFIHRELSFRDFFDVAVESGKLIGMLVPLVAVALSMSLLATEYRIPAQLLAFATQHVENPTAFILIVNLLLIGIGCVMDTISAILVISPLLQPVAQSYGFDATHLGIIVIMNLEIGFLTPPLGMNLIIAMTVFREPFGLICRAALPYVAILIVCLLLVTFMPWIALGLVG